MLFCDFIIRDSIQTNLVASDKRGIILNLVTGLVTAGLVEQGAMQVADAVLEREQLGSTAIGRGVATPHAKHAVVTRPLATIGISHQGVDFDSHDGGKTHLFFLTLSPHDRWYDHQQMLKTISIAVRDKPFIRGLLETTSPEQVWELLRDADETLLSGDVAHTKNESSFRP